LSLLIFALLALLESLAKAERLSKKFEDMGPVSQPVEQGCGQMFFLECIIMPPSLIALLIRAILEVWSYPRWRD